jgi:quercetin dioxygenase-like cupin family protein
MRGSVVYKRDVDFQDLGGGVSRRVLSHNAQMMMVEVRFEAGGIGAVHRHPHVQCTYVLNGRFRFTVDGEDVEVAQGDSIAFPGDVPHGTTCLEAGALLDVFTPARADFL